MSKQKNNRIIGVGVMIILLLGVGVGKAQASFIHFNLKQFGWRGGGEVNGRFSGRDDNGDGVINLQDNEVLFYRIKFSGNDIIPKFKHDLDDLKFFEYTLGSGGFRPSYPLFSDNGSYFYDADDKVIGVKPGDQGPFTSTLENASVEVVPEPATLFLLGSGILGFGFRRKRN